LTNSEQIADAMLSRLKSILGPHVYDLLLEKIATEYLGSEMDVRTAIMQRPEYFERAFVALLGTGGEHLLVSICAELHKEFQLDIGIIYTKIGDLKKCIEMLAPTS
jgi:hypothetical protein